MLTDSTPAAIAQVLKMKLGLTLKIDSILQRPDRCIAMLPDSQMAVLATSESGVQLMRSERKILQALDGKTSFRTPTIDKISDDETVDLRNRVPGNTNFNDILQRLNQDPAIARQITSNIAAILAELHNCLDHSQARELAPSNHNWPTSADWVRERLPHVVKESVMLKQMYLYLDEFESIRVDDRERVLCHGDPGLHNLAFNSDDLSINGIFDFEGATFNDPSWDLRYLIFGPTDFHYELVDTGIQSYQDHSDRAISKQRILFYNAISAITFLAYRKGIEKDTRWCGRTYDEDLAWTQLAISKLG
jgi:aminoglycoside phosphotransferase